MTQYTLHLGDCLEYMRGVDAGSVDAVITDPPYGIDYSSGWARPIVWIGNTAYANGSILNDKDTVCRDLVVSWAKDKPMAIFGTRRVDLPKGTRAILIWDKGPSSGMGDLSIPWKPSFEEIYILGYGWQGFRDEGILRSTNISRASMGRVHPHEKPVELIKMLLDKLPKNYTVFDPFMGSGTTGVACMQLGRNFIGCEIDPTYYAIAERRIRDAAAQPPLFTLDEPQSKPVQAAML